MNLYLQIMLSLALALTIFSGCTCFNENTLYGLDGKAVSWCEGKLRAEKLCKKHGGLKRHYYAFAECSDGVTFTEEVEVK